MSYHFNIHGVSISSFLEPYLDFAACNSIPDIRIIEDNSLAQKLNKNGNQIISNTNKSFIYEHNLFAAEIEEKGSLVRLRTLSNDFESISRKLLNLVVPFCLNMMGRNVFHASSISYKNQTTLFLGKSGSGKSTLSVKFSHCDFVSEDIVSIQSIDNKQYAIPSFNYVKLSKQAATYNSKNLVFKKKILSDRHQRSFYEVKRFLTSPSPVKNFVFLKWAPETKLRELTPTEIIANLLISSIKEVPRGSCNDSKSKFMSFVESIGNQASFYEYSRPNDLSHFPEDDALSLLFKK